MAKPKLALIPAAQGDKLYSVLPSNGVGDFDFTRSGSATRINSQGLIETVASGVSRLNYPLIDGVVKGCPHHLLEPMATNLVTYSEDFSQWDMSNTSYSPNQTISPDGTLNSAKIIPNTNNVKHYTYFQGAAMNNNQSWSIFVKAENYSNISITSGSISNGFEVKFDLSLGTVHSVQGAAYESSKIESIGNGWYRCSVVSSRTSGSWLQIYVLDDSHNSIFQGDGTSGIYLWGGQTVNSSVTTSYIPTSGSAVTRSAETANGSGDASTFNDSEGVLMAEISALADDGSLRAISISDGTNDNRVLIYYTTISNRIEYLITSGGITQASGFEVLPSILNSSKLSVKYKSNNFALWINGFKILTDVSGVTPLNLSELAFNVGDGTLPFYGNVKQLQYYDTALTDSELEKLTSWVSFTDMAEGQQYTIE